MAVIIWGEYDSDKTRGIVADRCPYCDRVTTFRVIQRYRVAHVYYIPLGSGKLIATLLCCNECGEMIVGALENYARVLPKKEAQGLSTEEILQQTNPRLLEALAYRAWLEEQARTARPADPGAPDPRVTLAFARLADLNPQDPRVLECQSRLAQWSTLAEEAQSELLRTIDDLVSEYECHAAVGRFVRLMGRRFQPLMKGGWGWGG
jgi:hypothetical protein